MGPYTLYLSLVYWMYPLNELLGDTGCYAVIYGRHIGNFIIQFHSFFLAIFRYTCLFHGNFLFRFNLTPDVSITSSSAEESCLITLSIIQFITEPDFIHNASIIQNILGLCKANGNIEFFGTNIILDIHIDRQYDGIK